MGLLSKFRVGFQFVAKLAPADYPESTFSEFVLFASLVNTLENNQFIINVIAIKSGAASRRADCAPHPGRHLKRVAAVLPPRAAVGQFAADAAQ